VLVDTAKDTKDKKEEPGVDCRQGWRLRGSREVWYNGDD